MISISHVFFRSDSNFYYCNFEIHFIDKRTFYLDEQLKYNFLVHTWLSKLKLDYFDIFIQPGFIQLIKIVVENKDICISEGIVDIFKHSINDILSKKDYFFD